MSVTRRHAAAALAALPIAVAAAPAAAAATGRHRSGRTVYLAGDSTCAQKCADEAPETGWGMALPFFLADSITVDNRAVNGESSRSFIEEGRLQAILDVIRPGDRLLIQFGHNDEKADDRHTDPWSTYQDYLMQYVTGARQRGARPVLLTSVERRSFDAAGNAKPTHGEYPDSVRALAQQQSVPVMDAQALSIALWQRLGPEGTKDYFNWTGTTQDNTHFQPTGAIAVARLVAQGLLYVGEFDKRDVARLDEAIPTDWITWPPCSG